MKYEYGVIILGAGSGSIHVGCCNQPKRLGEAVAYKTRKAHYTAVVCSTDVHRAVFFSR